MLSLSPLLLSLLSFLLPNNNPIQKIRIQGFAQGTSYHILYYANDSLVKKYQVDSIMNRLDSSLSIYKPNSLISRFNQSAKELRVDDHFLKVVRKAQYTWRDTKGIFDITILPVIEAWGFGTSHPQSTPDSATIKSLLTCVGSQYLHIKGNLLIKDKPCIKLDVNGIAQGYSVDVLAAFFEKKGISNYVIEVGGELRVKGHHIPANEKMKIAIEAPGGNLYEISLEKKLLYLDKGAITTSGSYRKFYESNGKRISHLLDARTGMPCNSELISVTVYARDAITADAYDNALMVMSLKDAMRFVEKRKFMAAHFIYRNAAGQIADTSSSRFLPLFKP
ncbi:MAG TPA: FAD:protein FMN transferase [Chitinophagaceae bacterium]|nr:FAD:protein FMN transferase [Chitinophagaceae bacterium]